MNSPLVGFMGDTSYPLGTITLPVILGSGKQQLQIDVTFVVVDKHDAYNGILGYTTMNAWGMIASAAHQKVKFPKIAGIGEVRGSQQFSKDCYNVELQHNVKMDNSEVPTIDEDPRKDRARPAPVEELREVKIEEPYRMVRVGASLSKHEIIEITALLVEYKELFTWSPSDTPGISADVISHKLNIKPGTRVVTQKLRPVGGD